MKTTRKILLFALVLLTLAAVFAACGEKETVTTDKLQNDYGVTVEGGAFDSGTVVAFVEVTDESEISRVREIIAGQSYNKEGKIRVFNISLLLDGQEVQPTGAVTVSVPTAGLDLDAARDYTLFHVKEDGAEALDITVTADKISFTTPSFSCFVLAEKEPAAHTHTYGALYYAHSPSFFEDGNIAYYHCEECGKYFDENKQEVESVTLARLSADVVLLVNGEKAGDFVTTPHENEWIEWDLAGVDLKKGDVIAVADKADNTKIYEYHPNTNTNVTDEKKAHNDADAANVHIDGTPNGLFLSVSGFEYDGIVIRINDTLYPMDHVTYRDSDRETYIYGYAVIAANDTVTVIDKDNDVVYDFDDLADATLWNTYDFHRGAAGELVFDYAARYGFEFDRGGDKKLLVTKAFGPRAASTASVQFNSERDAIDMTDHLLEKGSEGYEETMWYLAHERVTHNEDMLAFITENGLHMFSAEVSLEANETFNLKDLTNNVAIKADHLVDLYVSDPAHTLVIEGDYIKALKDVKITVTYAPSCDSIVIYESAASTADAYMMTGGNFEAMTAGAGSVVSYAGLAAAKNDYVAFADSAYGMLAVTLDPGVDASVWHRTEYAGTVLVYFDKAGTFDISLDLSTNVVSLVIVSLDETPVAMTGGSIYFQKNGGYKTLTANLENADELCLLNMEITDITGYVAIYDQSMATVSPTLASGSEAYATAIQSAGGTLVYITQTGTFHFYVNKTTHVLRIEKIA